MKSFLSLKTWSKRAKLLVTALTCVLVAGILQIWLGVWFVLGLPLLTLIVLVPVYCALFIYNSHMLLWVVAGTLLAGSVLFVDITATSRLFQSVCHDLGTQYHGNALAFSSDGQLVCNYYNEDTIYAPAISSGLGMAAFIGIVLSIIFNLLQIPFAVYRVLYQLKHRKLRKT